MEGLIKLNPSILIFLVLEQLLKLTLNLIVIDHLSYYGFYLTELALRLEN